MECLSKLEWINMDLSDGKRKSYKACNEKRAKETGKALDRVLVEGRIFLPFVLRKVSICSLPEGHLQVIEKLRKDGKGWVI